MTLDPPRPVILCVDDDTELLDTIEVLLGRGFPDHRVVAASGGGDALKVVADLHREGAELALILTDQLLGDTTGTELLGRLKVYYPEAARVILTGHAALESAIEGVRLGVDDYLEKPLTESELRRALRPLLERQQLRQDGRRLRRHAREAIRRMSSLLELAFRDVERPLVQLLGEIGDQEQAEDELRRAQRRLAFLWRLLREHGLEREASLDYFAASELVEDAKAVLAQADDQGLLPLSVPELRVLLNPPRLALFGDRALCRIALGEVLRNAWRFSPEGSPIVVIGRGPGAVADKELGPPSPGEAAQLRAGRALLSVVSAGALSQRDFLRIKQVLHPGLGDGPLPGAGLIVAKALLEVVGGALMFEGAPGREGTTFHLALPAAAA